MKAKLFVMILVSSVIVLKAHCQNEVEQKKIKSDLALVFKIENDSLYSYKYGLLRMADDDLKLFLPDLLYNLLLIDSFPSLESNSILARDFEYFGPDITPENTIFDSKILTERHEPFKTFLYSNEFSQCEYFENYAIVLLEIKVECFVYKNCWNPFVRVQKTTSTV